MIQTEYEQQRATIAELQARIDAAVEIAPDGMFDGDHHKMWVIDQMLRAILGPDGYAAWVEEYNSDEDYSDWDEGTPP